MGSFIAHSICIPSLRRIKKAGIDTFMEDHGERKRILDMLGKYNTGRSMTFYCLACTLMDVKSLKETMRNMDGDVDQLKNRI